MYKLSNIRMMRIVRIIFRGWYEIDEFGEKGTLPGSNGRHIVHCNFIEFLLSRIHLNNKT